MTATPDWAALQARLMKAMDEHEAAQFAYDMAGGRVSAARNELNAAQKAIDDAMAELKNKAPRDSDWRRQQIKSVETRP